MLKVNIVNKNWQDFLTGHGAVIKNGQLTGFGDGLEEIKAIENTDCLVDLSHYPVVAVKGEDAMDFLQGQLSNDIKQVSANHTQLSAYCTPKGRMLSIFKVWQYEAHHYLLTLPAELVDTVIPRLRMYVLRSKVELRSADDLVHIGFSGPGAPEQLARHINTVPGTANDCAINNELLVTRIADKQPRFEIIGPQIKVQELWNKLAADATAVGAHAWEWRNIISGLPVVTAATSEAFVPQMGNLDILDGISFKKGCYPGQEIVARMKYLGKLKQRMFRARVKTRVPPKSGDALYAPNFPNQAAGKVMTAEQADNDYSDLLIVAQISSVEEGDISTAMDDGIAVEIVPLPYEVPLANNKEQ